MTSIFQRLLTSGVLIVWGTVLCFIYFTGRLNAYLHPHFQPFTIACGFVLVLMAVLVLIAPEGGDGGCGAPSRGSLVRSVLLALVVIGPMLAALTFSKDGFGASTVLNRGYVETVSQLPGAPPANATTAGATDPALPTDNSSGGDATSSSGDGNSGQDQPAVQKNSKGEIVAEVIDLLYAEQIPEMRKTFENNQVEVLGQLMPDKKNNPHGDRYDVVRMFITCCAADAQPVALTFHPTNAPNLSEMTWVKIHGKATFPVIDGQPHVLVENATVEKTDPPEDTFLY
ncbi:MAG TPA: TIGR03943 family protein [Chthoniobacterales bacterium]